MKLGIDIGASHIGLGLVNENNEIIKKEYIPYKRPLKIFNKIFTNYFTKKYIKNLITFIDNFIKNEKNINYIGIGCPGGVDINNMIFFGSEALVVGKIDFKKELKKYNSEIYIDNDCNCAAVGVGINTNIKEYLMLTIGTGVGFSLIKKEQDEILLGKDERIWEILKINKVPNTKHDKYIMSFKKLSKLYNKKKERDAIFKDIENNNEILDNYINNFVKGINLINEKIPLKNICIGGSFSNYKDFYLKDLQTKLKDFNIFIAPNNNDAGIIGATLLPIKKY